MKVSCRYVHVVSSVVDILFVLERIGRVLQNDGQAEGLRPAQWEALRYLARANRFSRSLSGLIAYLGVTKGAVSQTISALESKGLVEKTVGVADRRQVWLELTASGRKRLKHDPLGAVAASLAEVSASRRQELKDGLNDLLRAALRQRGGRRFGICKSCCFFQKNARGESRHMCGLLGEPLSAADCEMICAEHDEAA